MLHPPSVSVAYRKAAELIQSAVINGNGHVNKVELSGTGLPLNKNPLGMIPLHSSECVCIFCVS